MSSAIFVSKPFVSLLILLTVVLWGGVSKASAEAPVERSVKSEGEVVFEGEGGVEGEGVTEGQVEGTVEGALNTERPTATLKAGNSSTVTGPVTVTLTLSESTPLMSLSALTTQNATASELSATEGSVFTFLLTPLLHGAFSVSIGENQFFDASGNGNVASNVINKSFDSRPFGSFSDALKNPVYGPVLVTLSVSEFIPNIAPPALTLENATVSEFSAFSGDEYTFLLTPIAYGPFSVSIAANQFSDAEGNGNKAIGAFTRHYLEWVDDEEPVSEYPAGEALVSKLISSTSTSLGRSVSIDGNRLIAGASYLANGWYWADGEWQLLGSFSNRSTYTSGNTSGVVTFTGFSAHQAVVLGDEVIAANPYAPHQRVAGWADGLLIRYHWNEPELGYTSKSLGLHEPAMLGYDVALAEWGGNIFYFASQPSEGKIYGNLGWSSAGLGISKVDAHRSIVVAGAPGSAAYAFNSTGLDWTMSYPETLTLEGVVTSDEFGGDVAVHGRTALVSAPGENADAGATYVFAQSESGWTLQARLSANDGAAGDGFGCSVSLWGNTAVVGAPYADLNEGQQDAGAVYVFRRTYGSWVQLAKLTSPDPDMEDNFGKAVDIGATDIAVGAPGDDEQSQDGGAVYVYTGGFINESVRELIEGASDGERNEEGSKEGIIEGNIEGIIEGIVEGAIEGVLEGGDEGAVDGVVEGVAEGVEEGAVEGLAEGTLEGGGESEGEGEGLSEGLSEGTREGTQDGEGEGEITAARHSLDTNANNQVDLNELLRVIQLYNGGAFGCALDTEDGFAPDGANILCTAHSGDYNPQDWKISLSELLRIVQLYNVQGFEPCPESEDGFCPVQ